MFKNILISCWWSSSCRVKHRHFTNSGKCLYLFFSTKTYKFLGEAKIEKMVIHINEICRMEKQVFFAIIMITWISFDKWIKIYFVDYYAIIGKIGKQPISNLYHFTILEHCQLKLPSNLLQDNVFFVNNQLIKLHRSIWAHERASVS